MDPRAEQAIKTMKLYSQLGWVDTELRETYGHDAASALDAEELLRFDGMHYRGVAAIDEAIAKLGIGPSHRLLDVGSGLGGPARQIAKRTGCQVVALELMPDFGAAAARYTERCGLGGRVTHVTGDFLTCGLDELGGPGSFDFVTGWLSFLHVADKAALLGRAAALLKPGGRLFAEDFFAKGALTPKELESLERDVYTAKLPSRDGYLAELAAAGFGELEFGEMTSVWTEFVAERMAAWEADEPRTLRVHGPALYADRLHFFGAMKALFGGGNLGGVRLAARVGGK